MCVYIYIFVYIHIYIYIDIDIDIEIIIDIDIDPNLWGFSATFVFCIKAPRPLFLWHLRTAFYEAHLVSPLKIWHLWVLKSYKVFMEPPCTIVTP